MNIAQIIVAAFLMVCCIGLIVVVMLQSNRGGEMSAITGRSGNHSGRGQAAKREAFLKRLTGIFGILFVVSVIVMNLLEVING